MKNLVITAFAAAALAGCTCTPCGTCATKCDSCACASGACDAGVYGNWSAKLPYDEFFAGSFIFSKDGNGAPKAFVLWRWGSPEWVTNLKIEGDSFSFDHPYGVHYRGKVCGDKMEGELQTYDTRDGKTTSEWQKFAGWRNKPVPKANTRDAKFGEPIDLLKDGLDGWKSMNPKAKFGWTFKDGVLSNKLGLNAEGHWVGGGANLMSKRADFKDFNLEYDVNVPKDSNSGVYLRGRYEIQVVDSYNQPVNRHNMAAYYGRVTPKVAAEKKPGEWQHVSLTLYKRHLTVVLNGQTIIDNAEVEGVTGGAIDADVEAAGPFYLQGDHSDADFKNMILRPAVN